MYQILNARYENGRLLLEEKLYNVKEGRSVRVIVLDSEETNTHKAAFLASIENYRFVLPDDYRFNRDELYDR